MVTGNYSVEEMLKYDLKGVTEDSLKIAKNKDSPIKNEDITLENWIKFKSQLELDLK